ncbi:MAG: bifunctional metallophosphatase/5'-nucleotidase [Bacteroidales bacterium]|nr:bifunctional metallophosphatase/5'-nucleotidase [Bacteroidales bacterium]
MKRFSIIALASIILASCSQKEQVLRICAVSDVHGKYFDSLFVGKAVNEGSLSKASAYIKELRKTSAGVIFIDNGDNLQGDDGAYYYNYVDTVSTHVYSRIANYLKYDAVIVGNHDIEAGHPNYDRVRSQINMPYLAANAIKPDGTTYFDDFTIVKKAGKKVAIIGMTNPNIRNWLGENLFYGMDFVKATPLAQELVDKIRAEYKPDYVVVAIHGGSGSGKEEYFESPGLYLANNLKGVDVVISGHDHRPNATIAAENDSTLFINPGSHCRNMAVATIPLGKKGSRKAELISLKDKPSDPEYNAEIQDAFDKVKAFTSQVVCNLTAPIDLGDAYEGPNPYVSLIHKVQLKATGAQLSFAAPLGKRNVIPAGDLLYCDLMKIYPFENQLYVIELTGKQVKDYLEFSYDNWINGKGPGYNYDSAAGLNYKVLCKRPKGSRIVISGLTDGTPFDLNAKYTIAMTSYRASGGGYLLRDGVGLDPAKSDSYIVDKLGFIRDYCYDFLKEQGTYEPTLLTNWKFIDKPTIERPAQH